MKQKNIEEKLQEIMKKRTGFDFADAALKDEKLCGAKIKLPARELLLLYYDIEKAFGFQIPRSIIWDKKFDCYHHIYIAIATQFDNKNDMRREEAL